MDFFFNDKTYSIEGTFPARSMQLTANEKASVNPTPPPTLLVLM